MIHVFTLGEGRSGTRFLARLFARNLPSCTAVHEPLPDLFGACIEWERTGQVERLRRAFSWKQRRIATCRSEVYFESSHAFLKSFADLAVEAWPDLKLVRVVRDPRQVARSYVHRWEMTDAARIPFRICREGEGAPFIRWALTGREPIFADLGFEPTLFQRYVVQWIEVENRAARFLDRHHKHADCVTLHVPPDLGDVDRLRAMFGDLGLEPRSQELVLPTRRNVNLVPTVVTEEDEAAFAQVVRALPPAHLDIFQHPPYSDYAWSAVLQ